MAAPTVGDLERFIGRTVNVEHALHHMEMVTSFARAYTRGRGFTDGVPADDIAAVIVTATARMMANPEGMITETVGSYSVRYSEVQGFNLVEQMVLNGYRRRAS